MISHDCGVILVNIPFNGTDIFEDLYIKKHERNIIASTDVKKLPNKEPLTGRNLAKIIRQFHDYEVFSIVKSPYRRAYEMWIAGQKKLKQSNIKKQNLGEYYENLLNGWNCVEDDSILRQTSYLKTKNNTYFGEKNVNFEVTNLFNYEKLIENNLYELNDFLTENNLHSLQFYVDPFYHEDWREHFDSHSIDLINYIFDEDFEYCGYGKI